MKNRKKVIIIELSIVFLVLIFPSYLSQDLEVDPALFSSIRFNITYIATSLPHIGLLFLILYLGAGRETRLQELSEDYGFIDFDLSLVWKTGFAFAGILAVVFLASLLSLLPLLQESEYFQTVQWQMTDTGLLPLVFITCLVTGYREEMLFRSYLLTRLDHAGLPKYPSILLTSLLFAGGHIYQGIPAFAATFFIGLFLGFVYLRFRNIHMIAIGHGLYNFFSLILYPFIVTFSI